MKQKTVQEHVTADGVFLERTPKIEGVTGGLHFIFLERRIGIRDGKRSQLIRMGDGYTTSWVSCKERYGNTYIDSVYSRVISLEEPSVKAAYTLIVEMDKLLNETDPDVSELVGEGEDFEREVYMIKVKKKQRAQRILSIMKELSGIKAYMQTMDEKLDHHIEAAQNVVYAHISGYWRGLKSTSPEPVDGYPAVQERTYPGRDKYMLNRDTLIDAIRIALQKGSETSEEED